MRQSHIAAAGVASETPVTAVETPAAVEKALQTLSNGALGYETLVEEIQDPALRSLVETLANERKQTVEATLRKAIDGGVSFEPETDGTVVGALHRAWLKLESAVSGDDALVDSVVRAESHAVEQLEEALELAVDEELADAFRSAIYDVSSAKERLTAWQTATAS